MSYRLILLCCLFSAAFGLIDVVVQDLGCWKHTVTDWPYVSFEGEDPILDGPFLLRIDAVQKCAKLAQKLGYTNIALSDGGLCSICTSCIDHEYPTFEPSNECISDGKGGAAASQVYTINKIITAKYVPIGCWKEDIDIFQPKDGYFLTLMGDWKSREDAIEKCARVAASLGWVVFAIGDGGLCYTSEVETEGELGLTLQSDTCGYEGKGSEEALSVYQITSMTNLTLVNLGCWQESSTDRLVPLLESRSDFLGISDYRSRPEAIERCAIYTSAYLHDTMAIVDGGACASSEKASLKYKELGESSECSINGKGGPDANQVYKIIKETRNITERIGKPQWPIHLIPLGCWKDGKTPLIPTLEKTDPILVGEPETRQDAVQRCAWAAKNRGFDVIAIQNGKCWSSKTASLVYHLHGQTEECDSNTEQVLQVYQLETIIEPVWINVGCYENTFKLELISLEGIGQLLSNSPKARKQPVPKCAKVAAYLNYTYFALTDGGICNGLKIADLSECVKSASCVDDGEGGRVALQVYKIKAKKNYTVENLGCWKDDAFRVIPTAEGSIPQVSTARHQLKEEPIEECAKYARAIGAKIFALQAGGICMVTEQDDSHYDKLGLSTECARNGKGGLWANQVYRIKEEWWESPYQLTVPEPWSKVGAWNCTWQWWKTPSAPLQ